MSLKLSEDQVRVVLEQMMRSFQDHFVPKEAANARSINRSRDGAAPLDVDQFTQQIKNVQVINESFKFKRRRRRCPGRVGG